MNDPNAVPPSLVQLTNDMLNGRLDSDGVKSLEDALRGNAAAQKFFRAYCQLHVNLHAETQAQRVIQAFASNEEQAGGCEVAIGSQADSVCGFVVDGNRTRGRRRVYAFVLTTAVSLALLAVGLNALRSDRAAPEAATSGVPVTAGADIVSVNITSAESRWLPIKDVGKIFIQGPAQLELIGTSRVKLAKGRVRVRITDPRGHGFTVETPQGHVTDLGTEFGVDVAGNSDTDVLVFEGAVNLAYPSEKSQGAPREERLVQGEGLSINPAGAAQRIMSIVRGDLATFRTQGEILANSDQLIIDVSDNIRSADLRSFYEIVPKGLNEDALAYVDRPDHDWNGVDNTGMPAYLVGADYVKPFCGDKIRKDVEITVTLAKPARLFVFFDDRLESPDWLQAAFHNTGDKIGIDTGPFVSDGVRYDRLKRGKGPGVFVNSKFSVWEQIVAEPGEVRLGPNSGGNYASAMYGIAAVPLEAASTPEKMIRMVQ